MKVSRVVIKRDEKPVKATQTAEVISRHKLRIDMRSNKTGYLRAIV